jgi:NitT/TauT family transport system permease protein
MSRTRDALLVAGALAGLAAVLELVGRLDLSLFLPRVSDVVAMWWVLVKEGVLLPVLARSLRSLLLGYAAAAVVGVALGLVLGRSRLLGQAFDPYVNMLMSAPLVALVPILITIFGISEVVVVVTVFLFSFFVVLVNTRTGMQAAERSVLEMARSFGASEPQIFRSIYLPAALPSIMVGLELGAVTAVKGLVVGEMLVALVGLGELLAKYGNVFLITRLYAVILTILVLALLCSYAVQLADRLVIRWK